MVWNITKQQACRFLINYHHLNGDKDLEDDHGIISYFDKVGCIQYDPLNVVGRNADLVLQSRVANYTSLKLESLLYEKRVLIDGWDKMMSIYKQSDWPYFSRIREAMKEEIRDTLANRNSLEAIDLADEVKKIILDRGPIQAKDINLGAKYAGSWGHKKMSSATLDYMYHIGMIGIANKRNTQKVYDVIESLIPKEILEQEEPFKTDEAFDKWYIKRRLGSVGLVWGKRGGGWLGYHVSNLPLRKKILETLVAEDAIVPVQIEEIKELFYIRKEDEPLFLKSIQTQEDRGTARFLAPLDNLLWDRAMIEELFDFSYTWEVYVPAIKRKYGYYVLPVLYKGQFVARFEPDLQRKNEPLRIKQWWWEDGIIKSPEMEQAILSEFKEFCNYLGAGHVVFPKILEEELMGV